ncbi:hypothetical protein HQ489_02340 [Candidatus Woesearchaeota archaeon]|nr:hypothetical protein [Candidatus Woesearchaeota archaeon]
MKHIILILITLLLIVGCAQEIQQPIQESTTLPIVLEYNNPNPKTHVVSIDYNLNPPTLNIKKGDSVVWSNIRDSYSNLIFAEFDVIIPGKTNVKRTFLSKGEYYYNVKETSNEGIIRVN